MRKKKKKCINRKICRFPPCDIFSLFLWKLSADYVSISISLHFNFLFIFFIFSKLAVFPQCTKLFPAFFSSHFPLWLCYLLLLQLCAHFRIGKKYELARETETETEREKVKEKLCIRFEIAHTKKKKEKISFIAIAALAFWEFFKVKKKENFLIFSSNIQNYFLFYSNELFSSIANENRTN